MTGIQLSTYLTSINKPHRVTILESTNTPLKKVLISGGGRCNLLPDTRLPTQTLLLGYPLTRGRKELISPLSPSSGVTPTDVLSWFNVNGVDTKIEVDGRTFPVTDDSKTVRDALERARSRLGVNLELGVGVAGVKLSDEEPGSQRYVVHGTCKGRVGMSSEGTGKSPFSMEADCVVLATGSNRGGWDIAKSVGCSVVEPVPSLFTLRLEECGAGGVLEGLSGVSTEEAKVKVIVKKGSSHGNSLNSELSQTDPLLITHVGISGPAALKTSAYGARVLAEEGYKGSVEVDWVPKVGWEEVMEKCREFKEREGKRKLVNWSPFEGVPRRLWANIATSVVGPSGADKLWSEVSKKDLTKLGEGVKRMRCRKTGKNTYKNEFTTAGGVDVRGLTKEFRVKGEKKKKKEEGGEGEKEQPRIWVVGEANNIDGVTGGWNFLNCWASGWNAGRGIGKWMEENCIKDGDA